MLKFNLRTVWLFFPREDIVFSRKPTRHIQQKAMAWKGSIELERTQQGVNYTGKLTQSTMKSHKEMVQERLLGCARKKHHHAEGKFDALTDNTTMYFSLMHWILGELQRKDCTYGTIPLTQRNYFMITHSRWKPQLTFASSKICTLHNIYHAKCIKGFINIFPTWGPSKL